MSKHGKNKSSQPVSTNDSQQPMTPGRMLEMEGKPVPVQPSGKSIQTTDSFSNFVARLGVGEGGRNQISDSYYNLGPFISRNRLELEAMYRSSWLVGAVVDTVAEDMTREGIVMHSEMKPDDIAQIQVAISEFGIWQNICSTIKWARLYGGCIAVLLIDGADYSTPLDIEKIRKDQFKGLVVLDRWMIQPSMGELITDICKDIGKPKYYEILGGSSVFPEQRIHYTRVMRFDGIELPYYQKLFENLWGLSVIERMLDRLIAFDSATQGAAQMLYKANLRVIGFEGLRQALANGGADEQAIIKHVRYIRMLQSNEGITVLDKEDTFNVHSYRFNGVDEVIQEFGMQISGATGIPLVRLFGQSPKGLNSTGESDIRNYYDRIKKDQVNQLKPQLEKLIAVICKSVLGRDLPEDFMFSFMPLWQMSETEKAQIASTDVQTQSGAVMGGIISKAVALKELKQQSEITGRFTNITAEDIEDAENEPPPGDLEAMMAGMGGDNPGGGSQETPENPEPNERLGGENPDLIDESAGKKSAEEDVVETPETKDELTFKKDVLGRTVLANKDSKKLRFKDSIRRLAKKWFDADFKEAEHPRGQPDNAGKFVEKGGGASSSKKEEPDKKGSKEIDISSYSKEAKEISQEQKMAQADYSDISARMSKNIGEIRDTRTQNKQDAVSGEINSDNSSKIKNNMKNEARTYTKYLASDSALKLQDSIDEFHLALQDGMKDSSLKGIDAKELNSLGMDCISKILHQEVESNRQQFTDHGIRHIVGDIQRANQIAKIMNPFLTGKEQLLLFFIGINHDVGYTVPLIREGGLRGVMTTKSHPDFSEKIAGQQEGQWDQGKIFTKEEYDNALSVIKTHDSTKIDKKDVLGTSMRISDNLSLFSREKLPGAFRYIDGGDRILVEMGMAAKTKDEKRFQSLRDELHTKIDAANMNGNLKRDLKAATGEMTFMTPKFTLGVLAGEIDEIKGDKDHLDISIQYDEYDAFLQKVFDMGQAQTKKFLGDYGEIDFSKTDYNLGDFLSLKVEGYKKKTGDADFNESDHPREKSGSTAGQFTSGGGGVATKSEPGKNKVFLLVDKEVQLADINTSKYSLRLKLGKSNLGKCFDSSGQFALDNQGEKGDVVHGYISFHGVPIGHGWIELPGDVVFDGTQNNYFEKKDYYEKTGAKEEHRYSFEEATKRMAKQGHYGPWERVSGILKSDWKEYMGKKRVNKDSKEEDVPEEFLSSPDSPLSEEDQRKVSRIISKDSAKGKKFKDSRAFVRSILKKYLSRKETPPVLPEKIQPPEQDQLLFCGHTQPREH